MEEGSHDHNYALMVHSGVSGYLQAKYCRAILMSACDFLFGKDLPPNLDFFLQNCRNLIGWVTIPAKIMQECRFDPYMGNDLVCVVRCPITPYHIREINRFFNSVMPQVLSLFKAIETGTK